MSAVAIHSQEFDANDDDYLSESWTRTNGKPLFAVIYSAQPTPSVDPTLTGHSLTWTLINSRETDSGDPRRYVAVYRALPTSNGSGTLRVNFGGGNTQQNLAIDIVEWSGVGSTNPVRDSNRGRDNGFGTQSVAEGSVQANQSETFIAAVINNNSGLTASTSPAWTSLSTNVSASPVTSTLCAYRTSRTTPATFSITGSTNRRWAAIMVQVGTSSSGGGGGAGGGGGGSSDNPGAPPVIVSVNIEPQVVADGDTATITVDARVPVSAKPLVGNILLAGTVAASTPVPLTVDKLIYDLEVDQGVITQTAEDNVWEWTNA